MKVIVVHEDGDRSSRVEELAASIRSCILTGSMRVIGVELEVQLPAGHSNEFVYTTA